MKKLIVFALMLSAIVGLVGCDVLGDVLEPKTEFEIAIDNMNSLESYEMEMIMNDVPLFGSITAIIKVDGNKTETSFFGQTMYMFEEDGKIYTIYDFEGDTYAFVNYGDEAVDEMFEELDFNGFTEEDFTVNEDGEYVATDIIDEMNELVIVIVEDFIVELRFEIESEGITITADVEFKDLNDVEVTLPVYEEPNAALVALFYFTEEGYQYDYEGTFEELVSLSIGKFGMNINYVVGEDHFDMTYEFLECSYYPESQEWQVEVADRISLQEYLEDDTAGWSETVFKVLDDLYEGLNE